MADNLDKGAVQNADTNGDRLDKGAVQHTPVEAAAKAINLVMAPYIPA